MAFKRANPVFLSWSVQPPFSTPVALAVLIYVLQMHSKVGSFCFSIFYENSLVTTTVTSPVWGSSKDTGFCQQNKKQNHTRTKKTLEQQQQQIKPQPNKKKTQKATTKKAIKPTKPQTNKTKTRLSDWDTFEIPLILQCLFLQPPTLPSTLLLVGQMCAAPAIPPPSPLKTLTHNKHKFSGKRVQFRGRQEIPRLACYSKLYILRF